VSSRLLLIFGCIPRFGTGILCQIVVYMTEADHHYLLIYYIIAGGREELAVDQVDR
jgi:hypothetical protein